MRTRTPVAAAGAAVVALTLFAVPSAQADPEPTRKDVEAAFHRLEVANEKVNGLKEQVSDARADIATLTKDIARQQKAYAAQRDALGASIVQQQLDAPLGETVNLLGSKNPDTFLEGLGAVQALNATRADELETFTKATRELDNRRTQLADRKAELRAAQKKADAKRDEIEKGYDDVKAEYDELNAADQAAIDGGGSQKVDFDVKANGNAKAAVDFALSQLGDPYVYGGTGPDGWDCSGLVQGAWKAAGVSLPRVVGPQMSATTPVSKSQLQPGDLVAYPDMSHDGLYIGNGKVVHAPRPGKTVEITSLSTGFTVFGRVG